MIYRVVDRATLGQCLDAVRERVGADELRNVALSAAAVLPGDGDPIEQVRAAVPAIEGVSPSSGGEVDGEVPYLARDPVASLTQSALEEVLRDEGTSDAIPDDPSLWHRIAHTVESFIHPVRFGPEDDRWVTRIAESVLKNLARGNHCFNKHPATHAISDTARLLIVGDWGTGVPRARRVAHLMAGDLADALGEGREAHVIHLGDVYYSGLKQEIERHVLAYWPVTVVHAAAGVTSWSLNGNHDMYSGGHDYFGSLLGDRRFQAQRSQDGAPTSYFRLTSPSWEFCGLDTSWTDNVLAGGHVGVLADPQASFVADVTHDSPGRRLVLLSHHQLTSVYSPGDLGPVLPDKLKPVLDTGRVTAWFWGHEHRCMAFQPTQHVAYPRCTGHGGVPVLQHHTPDDRLTPPGLWEEYSYLRARGDHWARFGHAIVDLSPTQLSVVYRDDTGRTHHRENIR
jgi:hypothetical protein